MLDKTDFKLNFRQATIVDSSKNRKLVQSFSNLKQI